MTHVSQPGLRQRLLRLMHRLRRDRSAVTIVEIGVSMPLMLGLALAGAETVNLAHLHMRLNQLAITTADNASRAKQAIVGGAPRMREVDVAQVFNGAALSVADLDFTNNGRVILSSLETNGSGGQWIHWQRCFGTTAYKSRYGVEGTGITGTAFAGMGQTTTKMVADTGSAIMFVEVAYNYRPMFFDTFVHNMVIRKEAAMYVRDDRDLTQLYASSPTVPATC